MSIEDRFWSKVNKTAGCWLWTGALTKAGGYGFLHYGSRLERKPKKAHRASWEIHNGPIPDGLWVLHKCDNPMCVRPDHLFLGNRSDNMLDCAKKGRVRTVGKAMLTHCKRGHPFDEENTLFRPNGHRRCAICRNEQNASRRKDYAAAIRGTK